MNTSPDPKIIVALDFQSAAAARQFVETIDPAQCRLKVGKELFTRSGPDFVRALHDMDFDVFLDLKFHDIPNTVARACEAACDLGVWMLNVHALGGRKMMEAAVKAIDTTGTATHLIAVTILTSMDTSDLVDVGLNGQPQENVMRLAKLANNSGIHGVVCSPLEVASLRNNIGEDFLLVTPGIRPQDSENQDQKRVMTPVEAMQAGSSYLVIGRPITQADNPMSKMLTINSEISLHTNT